MTTQKILHAADIHLDSPLRNLTQYEDAPAERIRGASRVALSNMVDLAIDQQVQLVVIAGDLYDGDWPDQNTGLFFVKQASRLIHAGIPVVVIRGNHDAFNKMTMNLRLPMNPDGSEVMISSKDVETREFDLGDLSVAVHGRSYRKQHERGDLVKDYPKPIAGMFNLGLLHTGLDGLEGHIAYAPCTPRQLADFEYDYWALGHIHKRGEHQVDGAAPVVFSGNIQGRKITESGPKGCVIVEIDGSGATNRTFHPLDIVRWELCKIDCADLDHPDDLSQAFEDWLDEQIQHVGDRLLVPRVELTGQTSLHPKLSKQLESITASLRSAAIHRGSDQVWMEKVKLRTENPRSGSSIEATDDGVMDSVQHVLQSMSAGDQIANQPGEGLLFPEETEDAHLDEVVTWMKDELSVLTRKLPSQMDDEDSIIQFDDATNVQAWIDRATVELMSRLQHQENA